MKRLLLLFLLFVPVAMAQNTFCAANLPCTVNGSWTFMGAVSVSSLNGAKKMDGVKYPFTQAGLVACLNDALLSNGGNNICDATAAGSLTFTSEVDVKNVGGSDALTLLLPAAGTWTVNITDGVSCGLKQFNKTNIIGMGTGNAILMTLAPLNSSTNVFALFCTDPAPATGGAYYRTEGFGVVNTVGATMAKGAMVIQNVFDQSSFARLLAVNSNGAGFKVANVCCGTSFTNILADGRSGAGALPLVVGDSTITGGLVSGGDLDIMFNGGSFSHPGTGLNTITIAPIVQTQSLTFVSPYMEPNATDITTAGMSIGANVQGVTTVALKFGNSAGGSTAYAVDVATWAGPGDHSFLSTISQTSNCVNDHIATATVISNGSNGQCQSYYSGGLRIGGNPTQSDFGYISLFGSGGVDYKGVSGNALRHGTIGGSYFFDLGNVTVRDGNGATGGSIAAKSFLPTSAGATDLGTTALPLGNLWLGTAATNNFKFQPAATAAARTISIPDPLTNVNLAFNLKATSAAFTTATTAATCVQNTTAVTGATTAMTATASPVSTPGVGAVWSAFVSSAGNVTINECAVAASAGGSIAFNITVTP